MVTIVGLFSNNNCRFFFNFETFKYINIDVLCVIFFSKNIFQNLNRETSILGTNRNIYLYLRIYFLNTMLYKNEKNVLKGTL